jgi:uncharacterized protein
MSIHLCVNIYLIYQQMLNSNLVDDVLLNFVIENTKHFDESHSHIHALRVTNNAHIIMRSIKEDYDKRLLSYIAMLHDVVDHKYPESITKDRLSEFIKTNLSTMLEPIVMKIINNVSFSKEDKGLSEKLPKPYDDYLIAVCDADRLEALGTVGLDRCIEYTKTHGGRVPEDVVIHCNEKLLRLLPEFFIKTNLAREMAVPLHDEVYKYVCLNENVFTK